MKFLYCTECGNMRPRGWMLFLKTCEICRNRMTIIQVKMTKVAPLYYAVMAATMVLLAIYLLDYPLPFGTISILAMAILTMILAFIDYSMSVDMAKEMVAADEAKRKSR